MGSKLVLAAHGDVMRKLNEEISEDISGLPNLKDCTLVMPGIVAIQTSAYQNKLETAAQIEQWNHYWAAKKSNNNLLNQQAPVFLIWCDDAAMVAQNLNNFLWVAFTRSNPAMDIRGLDEFNLNKHWGCSGPVIIDARIKPHHAPVVEVDPSTKKSIEKFFNKGGSLYGKL
jgi:4-hydroxy-3-polyprenylbenzoate decarboxylase